MCTRRPPETLTHCACSVLKETVELMVMWQGYSWAKALANQKNIHVSLEEKRLALLKCFTKFGVRSFADCSSVLTLRRSCS